MTKTTSLFAIVAAGLFALSLNACGVETCTDSDSDCFDPPANNGTGGQTSTDAGSAGSTSDAGTGGQTSTDAGTTPVDTAMTGPFRSPAANVWQFSKDYLNVTSGACLSMLGNLPGVGWNKGIALAAKSDNVYSVTYPVAPGTYELSYATVDCTSGAPAMWAWYATEEMVNKMSADDKAYIYCVAVSGSASPTTWENVKSCGLRVTVDSSGVIKPAGNAAAIQ